MQREYVLVVTDKDNPDGALCSKHGSWASLFTEQEAKEKQAELSESFPTSVYEIFKLKEKCK